MPGTALRTTTAPALPEDTFRFLSALYRNAHGLIELRLVHNDKARCASEFLEDLDRLRSTAEWFAQQNRDGRHVFVGVGLRRDKTGTKLSVGSIGALWADIDAKDFSDDVKEGKRLALAALSKLPPHLQPSIIVDSGNGYHVYWLLKSSVEIKTDEDRQTLERIMAGLADVLNGDSVHDLGRVMRLPGTLNIKDPAKPLPCEIIKADYDRRFEVADFESFAAKALVLADALSVTFTAASPTVALDALRVSPKMRALITSGKSAGEGYASRSEADAAVATAMVNSGHTNDEIRAVFSTVQWRIGERYREPAHGDPYLQRTIAKARSFVAANPSTASAARSISMALSAVFSAEVSDAAFIVKGLLREGSIGFVGGEPKRLKSMLALALAIDIASGTDAFSYFQVPAPKKVLFVEEEDDLGTLKSRLMQFREARDGRWPTDENFRLVVKSGIRIDPNKGDDGEPNPQFRALLAEISRFRPDVVIIDALNRIHTGDENQQKDMTRFMAQIEAIRQTYGAAVLLIHHFNKMSQGKSGRGNQRLRGSSVIGSWAENSLYVMSRDSDNTLKIDPESKHGATEPFAVRLEQVPLEGGRTGLRFVYRGNPIGQTQQENREKVLAALVDLHRVSPEGCTIKALAGKTGMSESSVRNSLKELEDLRQVDHEPSKIGGKGQKVHVYFPVPGAAKAEARNG